MKSFQKLCLLPRWVLACFFLLVSVPLLAPTASAQEVVAEVHGWKVFDDFHAIDVDVDASTICTLPEVDEERPGLVDPHGFRIEEPGMRQEGIVTAEFDIEYVGFVGTEGQQARAAFERAAEIWATHIASDVPITVRAEFEEREEEGVLASAGPTRFYSATTESPWGESKQVFFPVALASALAGEDLEADREDGLPHIRVFINEDMNWYYGTGRPAPGQFDFVSVIAHELGHGLGFVGSMRVDEEEDIGFYPFNRDAQQDFGFPVIYDLFVRDGQGEWITDEADYPNPSLDLRQALEGERDGLFFEGEQTLQANVFDPARLYAPPEWNLGSSYSHLDEETYPSGDINSLMTPRIARQEVVQTPGAITCGMFADMGWGMGSGCLLLMAEDLFVFNAEVDETSPEITLVQWVIRRDGEISEITVERSYRDAPPGLRGFQTVEVVDVADLAHPAIVGIEEDRISYQLELEGLEAGRHTFRLRVQNVDGSVYFSQEHEVTVPLVDVAVLIRGPYPNPAAENARVDVTAATGQDVTMHVFDSLGREVQRLQRRVTAHVPMMLELPVGRLASGVYYVRLIGETFDETRETVVVR